MHTLKDNSLLNMPDSFLIKIHEFIPFLNVKENDLKQIVDLPLCLDVHYNFNGYFIGPLHTITSFGYYYFWHQPANK